MRLTHATYAVILCVASAACSEAPVASPSDALTLQDAWTPPAGPVFAGMPVTPAPRVRVVDASGKPREGARVGVVVVRGNAGAPMPTVQTDAEGYATLFWNLQPLVGTNEMRVFLPSAADGAYLTFTVDAVGDTPSRVDFSISGSDLAIGGTVTPVVTLRDARNVLVAATAPLAFSSSDEAVATVSAGGMITGVGRGTAEIIVAHASLRDTVRVRVRSPAPVVTTSFIPAPSGYGIAFTPSRTALLANPSQDGLHRFDAPSETTLGSVAVGTAYIDIAVSPDSARALAAANGSPALVEIELPSGTVARTIALPAPPLRVRYSPDGLLAYASLTSGGAVKVNLTTESVTPLALVGAPFNGIALSSDGSILYVSAQGGNIYRIDAAAFAVLTTATVGAVPQSVALSTDESVLYVARGDAGLVALSATTLAQVGSAAAATGGFDVVVSPDGQYVFVVRTSGGSVSILDALTLFHFQSISVGTARRAAIEPVSGALWLSGDNAQVIRIVF